MPARRRLVRGRHRILQVEDDRIGPRRRRLGKAFGAVAGDEEQGAEAHQHAFFWISAERSHWQTISSRWLMQRRSEEHTSELQSLMRISYAVFCLKKKKQH